jgi:hypothetical protein
MCNGLWILAFVWPIALFAEVDGPTLAFAQAGSTGGAIGKTDKSVSGARVRPLKGAPHRPNQHRALSGASSDSGASHIAGRWPWTAICVLALSGVFENKTSRRWYVLRRVFLMMFREAFWKGSSQEADFHLYKTFQA